MHIESSNIIDHDHNSQRKNNSKKSTDRKSPLDCKTYFSNEFSKEVFELTYQMSDGEDISARHLAIAKDLASVEKASAREHWTKEFYDLLLDFKFVPGGRITSNAGTGLAGTTYINCFVSGFRGTNQDSMESIMSELKRQALILKSEGGYGFCANVLRPKGGYIDGIGGSSPGSVKLLEMWDTQSAVITSGCSDKKVVKKGKKKIRKGAQMVTMSIFHPDIEEFILAKQKPNHLTKFNMSVLVSDDFMQAVKAGKSWSLEFPDFETDKELYNKHWDGNLKRWKEKSYPVKVYKTYEDANELWNLIMQSTYNRNEPGILFEDTINRWNNLNYCEYINATNPCGEQVLPVGGSCLLGSLNLTQFIDYKSKNWDFSKLKKYIWTAVRFLDNVNDKTSVPLAEQRSNLSDKRRIGLGVLGYGSALMILKTRYGSTKALEITEDLCSFIMNEAYSASAAIAQEKGAFALFDKEKYLKSKFVSRLSLETKKHIEISGLRNSHLLSIQPTGNSSVLANNVSGGLEPLFMTKYIRTSIQPFAPEGLDVPRKIDWQTLSFESDSDWAWQKEGDEMFLSIDWEGTTWKFDKNRGLLKETVIKDYACDFLERAGEWEDGADWTATSQELSIEDHVNTMSVFSKYIDSSMSKTVNIPNDYSFKGFKDLYMKVYDSGTIKGCTSYRAGTMMSVLAAESEEKKEIFRESSYLKRPKVLDCDIHYLVSQQQRWVVFVGMLNSNPYEVFALKEVGLVLPKNYNKGKLVKLKSGKYRLEISDGLILDDIGKYFESSAHEALTRMISTGLRHGVGIEFIVSQLIKSAGDITSFAKAIARTLKKYITQAQNLKCQECGGKNLDLREGCFVCLDCGDSKCS